MREVPKQKYRVIDGRVESRGEIRGEERGERGGCMRGKQRGSGSMTRVKEQRERDRGGSGEKRRG